LVRLYKNITACVDERHGAVTRPWVVVDFDMMGDSIKERMKWQTTLRGMVAGPARYCPPRHPTPSEPSFIDFNDVP